MKYFEVEAKCGHVGRNNYILKKIYVCANNGKDAAKIVRNMGRVKHNHKDAIKYVIEINYEQYRIGREQMKNDGYFHVHNKQDQNALCDLEGQVLNEDNNQKRFKQTHVKQKLVELLLIKEWKSERNYAYE